MTRQQQWQTRMREAGRCITCGKRAKGYRHCLRHRIKRRGYKKVQREEHDEA